MRLLHTGQHYDRGPLGGFIERLGMREPDANLGVGSGTHAEQTAAVARRHRGATCCEHPADLVLVAGDVNSTLAAALAATKLHVAVAHIESGLRSRDWDDARGGQPGPHRPGLRRSCSAPRPDAVENLAARGDHRRRRPARRQHDDRQPLPAARRRDRAGRARPQRARGAGLRAGHPAPPGAGRRPASSSAPTMEVLAETRRLDAGRSSRSTRARGRASQRLRGSRAG